ncbi:hypothetical protein FF38_10770 [Lucilia cuprina]|uniref:DUF4219 domain-containing protein n=1 Tax=Lucilia cuprina TaxID=7375 RepID=A0A0L0C3Y6_LUCCU|nr:hypothetical protein FF38_10770 [Lucilia cuprina]
MSLIIKIDKLRGRENYNGWSKKVRMYLIAEGLWTTVSSINSLNEKDSDDLLLLLMNGPKHANWSQPGGRQNYNEWSRKLRSYLVAEGLWHIVRNDSSTDVVKIKRVKYIIICSIEDDLLETIDPDATPNAIWLAVQKLCTTTAT